MSKWQTPITDRAVSDILARTSKAFFNIADWLRIYGNTQQAEVIVNIIKSLNVQITSLTAPVVTDWPTAAQINTLIENIDMLREASGLGSETGVVALKYDWLAGAGAAAPDYEDVNDWERDLLLIRDYLANVGEDLIYCGVAGCGQARVWQARWRHFLGYVPPAASPVRSPRCGLAIPGTNMTRQNLFRRYAT